MERIGFNPSVIIDVGAYEGYWTLDVLEVFPNARVLMVEAQKKKEDILEKLIKSHSNVDYNIALLSATDGTEYLFLDCESASQVVENAQPGEKVDKIRTQTLDSLLSQTGFPFPDLLKLDVQGHEMEVLKGAEKSLSLAEICLLEIS